MKPEIRVFSKDKPCTKLDIWLCFHGGLSFVPVQVDVAHSLIGKNVPRVWERNSWLVRTRVRQQDCYELTKEGQDRLLAGIRSYLKNHPADAVLVNLPQAKNPIGRRVRSPL